MKTLLAVLFGCTLSAQQWEPLGPAPIRTGPYTGRVAAVACSPTNPDHYYVGGADGGVWVTRDGGASWTAVGDQLRVTAIGALALDPNDDNVVYAGLGEANFANHSRYGEGIAKSTNGGASWQLLARRTFAGRTFSRIRVDPSDPRVLYASIAHAGGFPRAVAARGHPRADGPLGVFKSTDGGVNWTHLMNGLPGTVSATDVAIDPSNPDVVYAAVGDIFGDPRNGVYKSTNSGARFAKLAGGLPSTDVGRITLAIAPSRTRRVLASVVQASTGTGGSASTRGVYLSDDSGATWSALPTGNYQATYGWYLCTSTFSPTNPDVILIGGLTCRRSIDAGASWTTVTPPHVDLHALEFDAAGRLLSGNDGGLHRSTDLGSSWRALNDGLGLVQFYAGLSVHPSRDVVYGGTQDNGTLLHSAANSWTRVLGGDGGYTSIGPNGWRVFVEYQGTGNLFRSINGQPFQRSNAGISGRNCFLPPHAIHPSDPMLMIYGTERLFRSTDGGTSWRPISPDLTGGGSAAINGLAFAPSDRRTIYVHTNDGRVQVTRNGGNTWRLRRTGLESWPRTRRPFAVHPTEPAKVWLAIAKFGGDQTAFSDDAGATWRSIDGDLPNIPTNTVAVDLGFGEPAIVYLGTDRGVWRSVDEGASWKLYGPNLPNAPVIDLIVDRSLEEPRLVAATQGRGAWQVPLVGHRPQPPRNDSR